MQRHPTAPDPDTATQGMDPRPPKIRAGFEPAATFQPGWFRSFIFLWISRLGLFFSLHQIQPLFPPYLKELGASSTVIGAVMAAFTIAATVGRVPVGIFIDRFRRLGFLASGAALISLSTLAYTWASSVALISLSRIVHGFGWACLTTSVNTLAVDIAPPNRRGEMVGYAAIASNVAAALGPIGGYAIFARFGYQGLFLCASAVAAVSMIFLFGIHEPPRPSEEMQGPQSWIELFAVPESLRPAVAVAFLSFCHGSIISFLPLYAVERGLGNPSLFFTVLAVSMLIVRPVAGPVSDRVSRRAVILPGYLVYLIGIVLLALAPSATFLLIAAVLCGCGMGATFPGLMTLAVDRASAQRRGHSLAQFSLFFDLGIGVGSIGLGTILDHTDQNYPAMYLIAMLVGVIGLIIYETENRRKK
jgi:MFS family permease